MLYDHTITNHVRKRLIIGEVLHLDRSLIRWLHIAMPPNATTKHTYALIAFRSPTLESTLQMGKSSPRTNLNSKGAGLRVLPPMPSCSLATPRATSSRAIDGEAILLKRVGEVSKWPCTHQRRATRRIYRHITQQITHLFRCDSVHSTHLKHPTP